MTTLSLIMSIHVAGTPPTPGTRGLFRKFDK